MHDPHAFVPPRNTAYLQGFRAEEAIRFKKCGTDVENCVAEWVEVGYLQLAKPVRGGGAPPTPPPRFDSSHAHHGLRAAWALAFHGTFEHTLDAKNQIGAVVESQPFGGEGLSGTGPKAGGPHYLQRFALERTFTVNTAAAGGNTALLTLDEP